MGIYQRADSPYWHLYLETTKQREPTKIRIGTTITEKHDSKALASALYHQRMNALAGRLYRLPSATPAIRFDAYATAYSAHTIPLHRGSRRELEMIKPLVAFFGPELLSAIDQDRAKAYMADRARKVSARTVNREVDLLKLMLRDAAPKYLHVSPLVGLKRLRTLSPKRRLLTVAEEQRLLAHADPQERALIIVGMDTLMRLGDLLALTRLDRQGPWLYVKDPKSGEGYDAALSPRAEAALDALGKKGTFYFPKFRVAENPRDWASAVRKRLKRLCALATPTVPYGRLQGGITFHWATRRTGATRMVVDQGVPVPVVQQQGNWKSPDVLLKIYTETSRNDQLKAVGSLSSRSRSGAKGGKNIR